MSRRIAHIARVLARLARLRAEGRLGTAQHARLARWVVIEYRGW